MVEQIEEIDFIVSGRWQTGERVTLHASDVERPWDQLSILSTPPEECSLLIGLHLTV